MAVGAAAFFANTCGIDIALLIDGERGDFFFRCAVEDEAFALRRDAIDEAAAVGSGDDVLLIVDGDGADVGFVALEKDAALAAAIDTEDFTVVASGDVETALRVEFEVPDVLGFGFEENRGGVIGVDGKTGLYAVSAGLVGSRILRGVYGRLGGGFFSGRAFASNFVDTSVGRSGSEKSAVVGERESLDLEFFRREDDGRFAAARRSRRRRIPRCE